MKKGNGHGHEKEHIRNTIFSTNNRAIDDACETNINLMKNVIDIQFNYLNLWHDFLNAQLERLSTAKELSDMSAVESGIATEFTSKFTELNSRLYDCTWKAMQKQLDYYNLPVLPDTYMPLFEGFEKALRENIKKRSKKNIQVSPA